MNKGIFVAVILFIIEMIVLINGTNNEQNVGQNNANKACSKANVDNNNQQNGTING